MADGDDILRTDEVLHVIACDAVVATQTVPTYFEVGPYRKDCEIHIAGINGDTVQVWGGSLKTKPTGITAATGATQIGSNVTADTHMALTCPPRWLGVMVSTRSAGTVNVGFVGSRLR